MPCQICMIAPAMYISGASHSLILLLGCIDSNTVRRVDFSRATLQEVTPCQICEHMSYSLLRVRATMNRCAILQNKHVTLHAHDTYYMRQQSYHNWPASRAWFTAELGILLLCCWSVMTAWQDLDHDGLAKAFVMTTWRSPTSCHSTAHFSARIRVQVWDLRFGVRFRICMVADIMSAIS